jgi:hypothetical protein
MSSELLDFHPSLSHFGIEPSIVRHSVRLHKGMHFVIDTDHEDISVQQMNVYVYIQQSYFHLTAELGGGSVLSLRDGKIAFEGSLVPAEAYSSPLTQNILLAGRPSRPRVVKCAYLCAQSSGHMKITLLYLQHGT